MSGGGRRKAARAQAPLSAPRERQRQALSTRNGGGNDQALPQGGAQRERARAERPRPFAPPSKLTAGGRRGHGGLQGRCQEQHQRAEGREVGRRGAARHHHCGNLGRGREAGATLARAGRRSRRQGRLRLERAKHEVSKEHLGRSGRQQQQQSKLGCDDAPTTTATASPSPLSLPHLKTTKAINQHQQWRCVKVVL